MKCFMLTFSANPIPGKIFSFLRFRAKMCEKIAKIGFLESVCPSVTVFLRIGSIFFSDFLHEVMGPLQLKSDRARFFGKILIFSKMRERGLKMPKNRVFGLLRKIESLVFARNGLK